MARVVLGLGSNLGNRVDNLQRALTELQRFVNVEQVSSLYESEPVGLRDQPWFLNAVCVATTDLAPETLLEVAKEIERKLGRRGVIRFGPRPIDVDILFYNGRVIDSPSLQVPHPRMIERAFVLVPLTEILPEIVHPVIGQTAAELLADLQEPEEVRLYRRDWVSAHQPGGEVL
ncbi:MAG: 2-amino-4-hydroxy-6-hydroxymethyldihydropteridine diphosphokinase [Chloroflexota bacterium]